MLNKMFYTVSDPDPDPVVFNETATVPTLPPGM